MGRCSDARDRLLATAAELLHERGYTAVSVADICESAGLKKGSFYHFFESKQALALATLERFAELNRERVERINAHHMSAREKLRTLFMGMYDGCCERAAANSPLLGCPIGNIAAELAGRDDAITDKLQSIFAEWREGIVKILEQADTNGELDVSDPKATAETLLASVQGAVLLARTMSDPEIVRRMGEHALAMLERPATASPSELPAS